MFIRMLIYFLCRNKQKKYRLDYLYTFRNDYLAIQCCTCFRLMSGMTCDEEFEFLTIAK